MLNGFIIWIGNRFTDLCYSLRLGFTLRVRWACAFSNRNLWLIVMYREMEVIQQECVIIITWNNTSPDHMTDTKNRLCKNIYFIKRKNIWIFVHYSLLLFHDTLSNSVRTVIVYPRARNWSSAVSKHDCSLNLKHCRNKTRMNHAFNSLWYFPRIVLIARH